MSIQTQEVTADFTGMIAEADYQEFIRYDGTDQSVILPTLIESAIRQAEGYCNASFGLKTFIYQRQDYISGCPYYLPFAPILAVSAVKVIAQDGTETALSEGLDYVLGGLGRKYVTLLSANYSSSYSVLQIEYSAGTAIPANVNLQVKEGILTILSENFENRMDGIEGSIGKMPRNSIVKLAPFRNNIL